MLAQPLLQVILGKVLKLTSLSLSFHICKMGMMVATNLSFVNIKLEKAYNFWSSNLDKTRHFMNIKLGDRDKMPMTPYTRQAFN